MKPGSSEAGARKRVGRPRGEYRKSKHTRAAILEASLEVFAEAGYHKGSLRLIADRVGMSEAGLLHHFPSKSALMLAVLSYRDDRSRDVVGNTTAGRDVLRGLLTIARDSERKPGVVRTYAVLSAEATATEHPAHQYFIDRYHSVRAEIRRALETIAAEGGLRPGVDPGRSASDIVALWDGLQVQWLLDGSAVNLPAQLEHHLNCYLTEPL